MDMIHISKKNSYKNSGSETVVTNLTCSLYIIRVFTKPILLECKKPPKRRFFASFCPKRLAGAEGIEPSSKVLETPILPLNYAPIAS